MNDGKEPVNEPVFARIVAKQKRITPPTESEVSLTEGQAQHIAQLVGTPAWKILKGPVALQRQDHIARRALQEARDNEHIHFYRGQAAELSRFIKLIEAIAKKYHDDTTDKSDRRFKK